MRHETGCCLGLVASRNGALPETRYAMERGAEAQRQTLATARQRALAERWEVRRVTGAIEVPVTVALPQAITGGLAQAVQHGLDSLRGIASSVTGVRQWE